MRFIYDDDREVPVSPDGTERTNFFPLTIRIISPTDETRPKQEEQVLISTQFSRLATCNRRMHEALCEYMAMPAVKALDVRVQEYMRFKDELRGFFYVKPQPYSVVPGGQKQFQLVGPKKFELILLLPRVRLAQEDGSFIDRTLTFIWIKGENEVQNTWKLQKTESLSDKKMEITIKRAGSDVWTSVELFCTKEASSSLGWNGVHVNSLYGTSFKNGDQMNVRYVHSGNSLPVSFDGTSATNIFPCNLHVIE